MPNISNNNSNKLSKLASKIPFKLDMLNLIKTNNKLNALKANAIDNINIKAKKGKFSLGNISQKQLKIAAVMDLFTYECFAPECEIINLSFNRFETELDEFKPDIILIESFWRGFDNQWHDKMFYNAKRTLQLSDYAHRHNIPLVFWNKEDPVHTNKFLALAQQADFVFTSDIDSLEVYSHLTEAKTMLLHFAAQPKIHNPLEKYCRQNKLCFAGSYYEKYPERQKIFYAFWLLFKNSLGIDIYDRNLIKVPSIAFPEKYKASVQGTLDYKDIDKAYKGYNYGLNINTVTHSTSMFARRVYELMACNTVVISNYSLGLKNMFGELAICTDDMQEVQKLTSNLISNTQSYKNHRLIALREVFSQHLYEDRLDFIVQNVFNKSIKPKMPKISLIGIYNNQEEHDRLQSMCNKQSYANKEIVLLNNCDETKLENIVDGDYFAILSNNDFYGENYISDIALMLRWQAFNAVGKKAMYINSANGKFENIALTNENETYKYTDSLFFTSSIAKTQRHKHKTVKQIFENNVLLDDFMFVADEFNYCKNYTKANCQKVCDVPVENKCFGLQNLNHMANRIVASDKSNLFSNVDIAYFAKAKGNLLKRYKIQGYKNKIIYSFDFATIYNYELIKYNKFVDIAMHSHENKLYPRLLGTTSAIVRFILNFYDESHNKLDSYTLLLNHCLEISLPQNVKYMNFDIKLQGSGFLALKGLFFSHKVNKTYDSLI